MSLAPADIPVGWSNPPPVNVIHFLLIFVGIPVLITLGILAAVYLPGVVRGESVAPAGARMDDQWFGGRRQPAQLESARRQLAAADRDTGGAGGTWDGGPTARAREFTASQRASLDQAIRAAEQVSRCEFSVFVGTSEGDPRAFAEGLHAALSTPARSVLVMVDPIARVVEVVTGAEVRRVLTDQEVTLAVLEMCSEFSASDVVRGLRRGVGMLAMSARAPRTLHTQP